MAPHLPSPAFGPEYEAPLRNWPEPSLYTQFFPSPVSNLEAAYRLLENEEMPGWLFMPKNGATTAWESWEGPSFRNIRSSNRQHIISRIYRLRHSARNTKLRFAIGRNRQRYAVWFHGR